MKYEQTLEILGNITKKVYGVNPYGNICRVCKEIIPDSQFDKQRELCREDYMEMVAEQNSRWGEPIHE